MIRVCDDAYESCPTFPGKHECAHWSLADPAAVAGTPEERHAAFVASRDEIRRRVIESIAAHTED